MTEHEHVWNPVWVYPDQGGLSSGPPFISCYRCGICGEPGYAIPKVTEDA